MLRALLPLVVSIAACTSTTPQPAPTPTPTPTPSPTRAALQEDLAIVLAPSGTHGSVLSPALRAAARELDVRVVEPPDEGFRRDLLVLLADEGSELVCGVGGTSDVVTVAEEFPAVGFCILGGGTGDVPPNVTSIAWPIDEGARLAGAGAAMVAPMIAIVGSRPEELLGGATAGARDVRDDATVNVAASLSPAVPGRVVIPVGTPEEVRSTIEAAREQDRLVVGWMADPRDLVDGDLPLAVAVVADVRHLLETLLQGTPEARFAIVRGTGPRSADIARRVSEIAR